MMNARLATELKAKLFELREESETATRSSNELEARITQWAEILTSHHRTIAHKTIAADQLEAYLKEQGVVE